MIQVIPIFHVSCAENTSEDQGYLCQTLKLMGGEMKIAIDYNF